MACLEVPIAKDEYVEDRLNGYVVLSFLACFIVAMCAVLLFIKYVYQKLKEERERERQSNRRKTERLNKFSRISLMHSLDNEGEDSGIFLPLDTNYISSPGLVPYSEDNADEVEDEVPVNLSSHIVHVHRSQSNITPRIYNEVVSILCHFFTSSHGSMKPNHFGLSCIHGQYKFMRNLLSILYHSQSETIETILSSVISNLCSKKRILESSKLKLQAKYEQLITEQKLKHEKDFSKNISVEMELLSSFRLDLTEQLELMDDANDVESIIKEISFGIENCYELLLEHSQSLWIESCDLFVQKNIGLWILVVERWSVLEVMRYRIKLIHDSVSSYLKKNNINSTQIDEVLNNYKNAVHLALKDFEKTYSKELTMLEKDFSMYRTNSLRSFQMQLDCERLGIRATESNVQKSKSILNKKLISQYTNLLLEHIKEHVTFFRAMDDKELTQVKMVQTKNNKLVNAILHSCEESLFSQLQAEELLSDEEVVTLGKEITLDLKEYKHKIDDEKRTYIELQQNKVGYCEDMLKAGFLFFVNKCFLYLELFGALLEEYCNDTIYDTMEDGDRLLDVNVRLCFRAFCVQSYFDIVELVSKVVKKDENIIDAQQEIQLSLNIDSVIDNLASEKPLCLPGYSTQTILQDEISKGLQDLLPHLQEYFDSATQEFIRYLNTGIAKECSIKSQAYQYTSITETLSNFIDITAAEKAKKSNDQRKAVTDKIKGIYKSQMDFKKVRLAEDVAKSVADSEKQNVCFIEDIHVDLTIDKSSLSSFCRTVYQTITQERDLHKALKLNLMEENMAHKCSLKLNEEILIERFLKRVEGLENSNMNGQNKDVATSRRSKQRSFGDSGSFRYKQFHDSYGNTGSKEDKKMKRQGPKKPLRKRKKRVHAMDDLS